MAVTLERGTGTKETGNHTGGFYWNILSEGKRAGKVYINLIDEKPMGVHASLSIFLNKDKIGKGIGRQAISLALKEQNKYTVIYAHLRKSNKASRKALEYAGFKEYKGDDAGKQLTMVWKKSDKHEIKANAENSWFDRLSNDQRKSYFQEHPASEITKKFKQEQQDSSNNQEQNQSQQKHPLENSGLNSPAKQQATYQAIQQHKSIQETLQPGTPQRLEFGNQIENLYRQPVKDVYNSLDNQQRQHMAAITEKLRQNRKLDRRDSHALLDFSSTVQKYHDSHQQGKPSSPPSMWASLAGASAGLGARYAAMHIGMTSFLGIGVLAIGSGIAASLMAKKLVDKHREHQRTGQIKEATKGLLKKNQHLSSVREYYLLADDSTPTNFMNVMKKIVQHGNYSAEDWSHVLDIKPQKDNNNV